MKTIQKCCLLFSIIGCLCYGMDGIFQWDVLNTLELHAPGIALLIKTLFAASGMINILLFSLLNQTDDPD